MRTAAAGFVLLIAASAFGGCGGGRDTRLAVSVTGETVSPRVLGDVRRAVERQAPAICGALHASCRFAVAVDVYPNQRAFDEHVMNPAMRGYRAVSGRGRIQLVSPAARGASSLPYRDGLMVAVHEFTHLALDEINTDLPTWLDEGAAVYFGPSRGRALYDRACREYGALEPPSYASLTEHYADVDGADLYAYTLVASMAESSGTDELRAVLRDAPGEGSLAGLEPRATSRAWHEFLARHCRPVAGS